MGIDRPCAPRWRPEIEFHLLKSRNAPPRLSPSDNVVEHVVTAGSNSPLSMWFLPEFAPLGEGDIYHATANTLPARIGMKSVVTLHDLMWLDAPHWCDASAYGAVKRRFFGHGIRRALAKADRIAAISEATRGAILARDAALERRTVLTRPGVHPRFSPAARDDAALARLGIEARARFILVVGQYAPYKNHEGAVRAFAAAGDRLDGARMVLVQRQGPGPDQLRALARSLGVYDRLIFTGPVDESALIQLYSSAQCLLHPSLCEGFGNPIAEAMACGCPVITSALSAMPEVVGGKDRAAAILIDPHAPQTIANALVHLCSDRRARAAMREAGLARAAELSWRDFAAANVAIYRELLASP